MVQKSLSLFLSGLLLTTSVSFANQSDVYFTCHGFDPTWSMTITDKTINFKLLGGTTISMPEVAPLNALGYPEDYALVYYTHINQKPDQRVTIVLKTDLEGCQDKVAGKKVPYDALILFQKRIYVGCCKSE